METYQKDKQYIKFSLYGFLKNLRFFDAFLLIFFLENGISYSQIGILYAAREIFTNIFEVPSGIVADVYGRKNSLMAAFLLYILSFLDFYLSSGFYLLLAGMILFGMADAFRSGTHKGMIMDYLKLQNWSAFKVDYYGHTRSWSQKGSAVSALLAGLIVLFSGSYPLVYLISIIPYLINFVNIYTYPEELNFSKKGKERKSIQIGSVVRSVLAAFRQKRVLKIVNSAALHSAYLKAVKDYIQPLMVQIAVLVPIMVLADDKRKSGLVIGMIYFLIYLLTSYASRKSGKVVALNIPGLEKKTLLAGLIAGILCGFLYSFGYWIVALLLFILIFMVENLRKPILTGYLADHVSNEILTSVLSVQSFYQTVVTATLSLGLGVLADHFGVGISLMIISGVLILLTLFLELAGGKSKPGVLS